MPATYLISQFIFLSNFYANYLPKPLPKKLLKLSSCYPVLFYIFINKNITNYSTLSELLKWNQNYDQPLLLRHKKNLQYNIYLYLTLINFFEKCFKTKIFISNRLSTDYLSNISLHFVHTTYLLTIRTSRYRSKVPGFSLYIFLFILGLVITNKDLSLLKNYITSMFKHITFKNHKKILSILRYSINLLVKKLILHNIIKGFTFYVSGKIGLAGSVQTRSWAIKYGISGVSQKNHALKQEIFPVWTKTGALGLRILLVY